MSLAEYDAQLSSEKPQTDQGGLAGYDQSFSSNPSTPQAAQDDGYNSIAESAQKNAQGGDWKTYAKDIFSNLGHDTVDTVKGLGTLAVEAPIGGISNLLSSLGLVDKPTEGFLGQSSKVASALPGAVAKIPGQVYDFGKEVVTNPHQAAYDVADSAYQHPLNALLTASGLGDLVGSGAKIVGGVADKAATQAAIDAAGLTGEDAASALASRAATPGLLTTVGEGVSNGANALNPLKYAVDGTLAVKDTAGDVVKSILGKLIGKGEEGTQAIEDIAGGGDIGRSAVSGMRGLPRNEESQAFKDAVTSIDMKNVDNANMFSPDTMSTLKKQVADTLGNHGINVMVMTPEDQNIVLQDLQRGVLTPQSEQVFDRYWSKAGDSLTNAATDAKGAIKTKFLSSEWKPELSAQQKATILEEAVGNGGLVGVQPTLETTAKYTDKTLKGIMERVVKPIFQTGSYNGYEANAQNMQTLKEAVNNLHKPFSPLIPSSSEDNAINALSKELSGVVQAPLRQFPEYQSVMDRYNAYYGGKELNQLAAPSLQNALGSSAAPIEAASIYGLTHVLHPALGPLLGLLTSPRGVGELANLYGKAASVTGAVAKPLVQASQHGALSALLNLLGNTQ